MRKSDISRSLGVLKVMTERLAGYVSIFNFGMILYLYIVQRPLGLDPLFWVMAFAIVIPLILIVDWRVVYPMSLHVVFGSKNKEFKELRRDVREIKELLRRD